MYNNKKEGFTNREEINLTKSSIHLKPRLYISFIVFLLAVLGSSFYYFHHASGEGLKEVNLKYGNDAKQTLDLYMPKAQNGGKLPVIIYAHGGGWSGGDKTNVDEKPAFFTNKGYVFISINHRLSPKATYEEMANDMASAVKWVYSNANQYHIDTAKVNLMGHSSGGHLMMLIATNPVYLNNVGLSPKSINSIVNIEGPLDLTDFIRRMGGYKKIFGNDQKVWAEASPVTYAGNKNLPPMFLIARGEKSIASFLDKTKIAGNTVDFFNAKTLSHSQSTSYLGTAKTKEAADMTNAVTAFLKPYN